MATGKVIVVGPPGGDQGSFVGAVSNVRIRASNHMPSGEGFIPMDYGRVQIGVDLDLQIFGVDRDQIATVADALSPGIAGALVLICSEDLEDPHYAGQAFDVLAQRGIPYLSACKGLEDIEQARFIFSLPSTASIVEYNQVDLASVKEALVRVLETAMQSAEGSAA
jgi:signal recognition particle receptor subunit beta